MKYKVKTKAGTSYWPTFDSARAYAEANGYPTNRINEYALGWAIQQRISGPYVVYRDNALLFVSKGGELSRV